MHYQLLNILRRFVSGKAGRWLVLLIILLPLAFILSRYLGLSRNLALMMMFGVLVIIVVVWALGSLRKLGSRKRSKDFENDLGQHARQGPASREEINEAVSDLSQQWSGALQELKEHGTDIYALPWFLLIGEPQSGKSTTLAKSGLEFPIGTEALSGVGGTRNCDWWFTEEAVILDTAGRYAFQEDAAPDRHEWEAFLNLLRKHRRECPINGVLVVIPATSLTEDTADEQRDKAENIRKKLRHLQKTLQIRFPVFILITKSDRILGFSEFFSQIDPEFHGQIFGWSNPEEDKRWDPQELPAMLDEIVLRSHKVRLRLLQQARDADQVDRMLVFPEELAALEEPLQQYLHTIFHASRFEEHLIFRGFYLTSGLQEGRPIARACRELLRVKVGDPQGVLEDLETVFTRQYAFFIRDFYEKKVFPEKGLVKRTQAALHQEKRYRWVFRGILAAAGLALAFLLVPALLNLARLMKPINELTIDAETCLKRLQGENPEPCRVDDTYKLVRDIEKQKEKLSESKWTMRMLLRRGVKNEMGQELLPTVQAALLGRGVLEPVLDSFDARSSPDMWKQGIEYELFYQAFEARLRFDQYQRDREAVPRERVTIEPLLRFLAERPGADPTYEGEEIDEWLANTSVFGDVAVAEGIFQKVLAAPERYDVMDAVGDLEKPGKALAALEAYWQVELLARWDYDLIESYFRIYQESWEEVLALDPVADGAEATLASLSAATTRLAKAFDDGSAYMARGRAQVEPEDEIEDDGDGDAGDEEAESEDGDEEEGSGGRPRLRRRGPRKVEEPDVVTELEERQARPGPNEAAWQEYCEADLGALQEIYDRLTKKESIEEHCRVKIPGDWNRLLDDRRQYDHLFVESGDRDLGWSDSAAALDAPLVELAGLVSRERTEDDRDAFAERLDGAIGDTGKVDELRSFYEREKANLWAPVEGGFADFERSRPDSRFQADRGYQQAQMLAALAAGSKILPPARGFLVDQFSVDCESCFTGNYAETFVKPANEFLGWANDAMSPVLGVREISVPLEEINDALYAYLETFIGRLGGGGGGGGFQLPYSAKSAATWPRFTETIRRWQPTVAARRAPSSSDGLTLRMLQDFANANGRLRPLVSRMQNASEPRDSRPVELPRELEDAINRYRATIEVLDDEPLTAWKQLARSEDGASLEDFHAFSRNRRLARDSRAQWLTESAEEHGAELLSEAIRPQFRSRADELWRYQESCCRDRFPFITETELQRKRLSYERGYEQAQGRGELWLNAVEDRGRRVITLPILLETVGKEEIDRLFFSGGRLDEMFEDFALDPIVELGDDGKPRTSIDFVGPDKEKLRILRQWQRFLYGEDRSASFSRALSDGEKFTLRIIERQSTADRTYVGERASLIELFGPHRIRPSTDAGRGRVLEVPLELEDRPLSVHAINEDRTEGWTGRLELRGGPLKLLYFVLMASERGSLADGREWTIRIEVPDFQYPNRRLEGVFDLVFDKPLPGVLPDPSAAGSAGRR